MATDIPGNRDLVVHEQTGYLYPIGDLNNLTRHSVRLLRDESLWQTMSQAASARAAEEFSLQRMIERHDETYQHFLSSNVLSDKK